MPVLAYTKLVRKPEPRIVKIDPAEEKEVIFWPPSLAGEIKKDWPEDMRREGGFQLGKVQQGLEPDNYRPMPTIGAGVREIKLQDDNKSQYRLIYIAKFEEAIYVFHVITKKTTQKTNNRDIDIAKKRLNEIIQHRKKRKNI
jgi:phage-related protein